jgi:hypothetical protein
MSNGSDVGMGEEEMKKQNRNEKGVEEQSRL